MKRTHGMVTARVEGAGDDEAVTPWAASRLVAHHLLPGVASLAAFLPLAWLFDDWSVPTMVALFLAVLIAEVPLSWYLMVRGVRAEGRSVTVRSLFPWRRSVGVLRMVGVGVPLALLGMIAVFGGGMASEPIIRGALFAWIPQWMILEAGPAGMEGASRAGAVALWGLSGVVGVGIGGMTQELYHRGFLLPRAGHLGWSAVPFNALFFAVFHLAAPWGWPTFFLAAALWAGAVYRWRSIQLGLIGHVGMLGFGWLMMTAMVFGLIPS